MREINLAQLKEIQLGILRAVAQFCRKNSIRFWLDSGTLLGAVRHKGYIPWDDDIDIGMFRSDYNKMIKTFNQCHDRYQFMCLEIDDNFYLPHAKVFDRNTILFEPDENGARIYVNIDVFVFDNAPDNNEMLKRMYDKRDFYRNVYYVQTGQAAVTGSFLKVFLGKMYIKAVSAVGNNYAVHKMAENSKKYAGRHTKRVGSFTSYTRMACNKSAFNHFIDIEFEGELYPVPAGYDELLRSYYGEYMRLPPVEKRVSHHSFRAFLPEQENAESGDGKT